MKNMFTKLLSALMIAALFLMPTGALMEEAEPIYAEAVEDTVDAADAVDIALLDQASAIYGDILGASEGQEAAEAGELMEGGIALSAAIPDEALRSQLSWWVDSDRDGKLSAAEIANVKSLWINSSANNPIKDFTGLTLFTNLEHLSLIETNITAMDATPFTKLQSLEFYGNKQLATLNVTGLANLTWLTAEECALTSLDVTGLTALKYLYVGNNKLTALDVSNMTNLVSLDCRNNQLTSLKVDNDSALEQILCNKNSQLTTLDLITCPKIVSHITDTNKKVNDGIVNYEEFIPGTEGRSDTTKTFLACDAALTIVTKAPDPEPAPETVPAPAPETVPAPTTPETVPAPDPMPAPVEVVVPVDTSAKKSSTVTTTADVVDTVKINTAGTKAKKFKSSDPTVATVNKDGTIKFKKAGKVKITYMVGKKKRTVVIKVTDRTIPSSVTVTQPGTGTYDKSEAVALTANLPANTWSGIKWKSSNKKVATVSKQGVVKFKKAGKVKITATTKRGKKKSSVTLTAIDGSRPTAIEIVPPESTTLTVGAKITLTAKATMSNPPFPENPTYDPTARWSSSNKKVATINKKTGELVAKKAGTATITVSTGKKKNKKTSQIVITVVNPA